MNDGIDAAIAAAATRQEVVQLRRVEVLISSTRRPAAIEIPVDASDAELAELCGWILTNVMNAMRAERIKAPSSRILVPS